MKTHALALALWLVLAGGWCARAEADTIRLQVGSDPEGALP